MTGGSPMFECRPKAGVRQVMRVELQHLDRAVFLFVKIGDKVAKPVLGGGKKLFFKEAGCISDGLK